MKAKMLVTLVAGFLCQGAQAQISRNLPLNQQDTFSSSLIAPPAFRTGIRFSVGISRSHMPLRSDPLMDANLPVQHLPFFCRQEARFEKRSGLPLRMRLGSLQQTDWLEQKAGTVAPW